MRSRSEWSFPARLAMTALAVLLGWVLYLARRALLLVYLSALIAVALSPLVRWIERYALRPIGRIRVPRPVAILVIYLAVLGTLTGVGFLVVPAIVTQARDFVAALPQLLARLQTLPLVNRILGAHVDWQAVVQRAGGVDALANVTGTFFSILGGLLGVLVCLFLTFYFLVEGDALVASVLRFLRPDPRQVAERSTREIGGKVSAWLVGHVILGVTVGGTVGIVLGLLGVPFFYVLALVGFLGEFVPYLGPIVSAVIATAVAATVSGRLALEVVVFYVILGQIEGNVLAPKIFERQVGLSAATIIVAMLVGGELAGLLGVVLAIPTTAILYVVLEEALVTRDGAAAEHEAADEPRGAAPAGATRVPRPATPGRARRPAEPGR